MTALTDAEILSALPTESRQKINNAFEALSQSSPSPTEQAILYRVAHTLKLNPTDTVFSVVAAMHYYLQLYQTIPSKITKAGGEIREAGAAVNAAIRKTTEETLTEHAGALKAQAELVAAQNQQALIRDVGKIAQQIAGNTAAAERQKSFVWAAGSLTVLSMLMLGTGMALGSQVGLGAGFLAAITLGIGLVGGMVLCQVLIAGEQVLPVAFAKATVESKSVSDFVWTPENVMRAGQEMKVESRTLAACQNVLINKESHSIAAAKEKIFATAVGRGIHSLNKWKDKQ